MKFKYGDVVKCISISNGDKDNLLLLNRLYTVKDYNDNGCVRFLETETHYYKENSFILNQKENNMLKEIAADAKEFVKNNRNVIYTIVVVALIDHFMFKGALRDRIKGLLEKMLNKAEKSVD